MAYEMLLSPIKIGNLTVKNRVAMTAMAVEAAELDGKAGDRHHQVRHGQRFCSYVAAALSSN